MTDKILLTPSTLPPESVVRAYQKWCRAHGPFHRRNNMKRDFWQHILAVGIARYIR